MTRREIFTVNLHGWEYQVAVTMRRVRTKPGGYIATVRPFDSAVWLASNDRLAEFVTRAQTSLEAVRRFRLYVLWDRARGERELLREAGL